MIQQLVRRYSVVNNLLAFIMGMRMPIFFLMLSSKGFDLQQVGWLIGILSLSAFVFEIPFGSLADRLGRKKVYLLGEACLLFSYVVFWLGEQWILFALAMLVNGMGKSLMSGSIDALFVEQYQRLAQQQPEQADLMRDQAKVLSRSMLAMGAGALLGGVLPWAISLISSFLMDTSFSNAELLSWNFALMSALVLVHWLATQALIHEPKASIAARTNPRAQADFSLQQAILLVVRSPVILAFMCLQFATGVMFISLDNLWQPQLNLLLGEHHNLWLFGVISSISFFCMSLGQKLSIRAVKQRERTPAVLQVCQLGIVLVMALLASAEQIAFFALGYIGINMLSGMMSGPLTTLFHGAISDQYRSTLLSVRSSFQQAGGLLAAVGGGAVAASFGIAVAWWSACVIGLLAATVFLLPSFKHALRQYSAPTAAISK